MFFDIINLYKFLYNELKNPDAVFRKIQHQGLKNVLYMCFETYKIEKSNWIKIMSIGNTAVILFISNVFIKFMIFP